MTSSNSNETLPRIYCAGPLFNQSERDEMTSIARVLGGAGFPVFLPHRDGMEFRKVHRVFVDRGRDPASAGRFLHEAIFALDVYQLAIECGAMVWNLNGRVPDEGAVSEAAIAWTLGKPLVAYTDDVRSLIEGRRNPLLAGLVDFETIASLEEIPAALKSAIDARGRDHTPRPLASGLRKAVAAGGELWQVMQEQGGRGDDERIADIVAELFASKTPPDPRGF